MKLMVLQGRQPFTTTPSDAKIAQTIADLRSEGHDVDYVWLPTGGNDPDSIADATIAASLLHLENTDAIVTFGFPTDLVPAQAWSVRQ